LTVRMHSDNLKLVHTYSHTDRHTHTYTHINIYIHNTFSRSLPYDTFVALAKVSFPDGVM